VSIKEPLQQQAVLAAARAVLTHDRPVLEHLLLAPRNLDILPLLAVIARDYARFAEPPGGQPPRVPIALYDDGTWPDEVSEISAEMRQLLNPAWFFDPPTVDRDTAIMNFKPQICISVASPERARVDARIGHRFERVVYLAQLSSEGHPLRGEVPPEFVAADASFRDRIDAARAGWDSMLTEGESFDLEPFVAFGPAIELAIWGGRDEREGPPRLTSPREQ
jgi:hypothetical protein